MNIIRLDVEEGVAMKMKAITIKSKDLLRMEMNIEKDDDGNNDDLDLKSLVVIEDPKKPKNKNNSKNNNETETENTVKKLVRADWLPWWDLLVPSGYTLDNIDNLKERHCGNCARGMRATSMRYKSTSQRGCGIAARIQILDDSKFVRVTSHCSGNWHDYPVEIIELDQQSKVKRQVTSNK